MIDKRGIVIYSGGMDSFTLLNSVIDEGYNASAITFDYGQKHKKEIELAKRFCEGENIEHQVININEVKNLLSGSALIDKTPVPHGHYQDIKMKATVVPNRNMVFLSLATAYAISSGTNSIFFGVHSGDYDIYYDCRPEFVEKMNEINKLIHDTAVQIKTPFIKLNKGNILKKGIELNLDYSLTWTCYEGGDKSCGKCGACVERLEAFSVNLKEDPLEYQ
tara:strand:+ start:255 stop:914 length:660 start_codon:yes stop_codon:yes gene_type:complete